MTQQPEITTKQITSTIQDGILTIAFLTGDVITINPRQFSDDVREMAMLHGFKQKLVDAGALSAGATLSEKYEAIYDVYQRLLSGEWNKRRESGEPRGGLLFNALCRAYPQRKPEEIREFLSKKSRAEQNAMLNNSRLRPHIDAIRAEMAKNIESDDLLDELEG